VADKVQLNTTITTDMREALRQACQERGCAQSDLIEEALVAFLAPGTPGGEREASPVTEGMLGTVLDKLTALEAALPDILDPMFAPVCEHLIALEQGITTLVGRVPAPPPPAPPAPTPRIATYEQMYGPPESWVDPHPLPPIKDLPPLRRGFLARWLFKEV